jgi:pyrroline-5-carboxylate reductase
MVNGGRAMSNKLGFIGCGNMGGAMLKGILSSEVVLPSDIYIFDVNAEKLEDFKKQYAGINICGDVFEVAQNSDFTVLAIKPNMYEDICCDIRDGIAEDNVIISIAAGIGIQSIQKWFKRDVKVVRAMPNTPALVMAGMTALSFSESTKEDDMEFAKKIFSSFSTIEVVSESIMDAIPAISGSSPAYVFMMIEAMGDAGVKDGVPRAQAYKMAAQTILGSAKMFLETGLHPGQLKDMVTSPAGTTIEAVAKLEERGFKSAIMEAMKACTEKSEIMSKKYDK